MCRVSSAPGPLCRSLFPVGLILAAAAACCAGAPGPCRYTGVNLAGAEFTSNVLPGECGRRYTYPTAQEIDYFAQQGMNVLRLPFRWERLQKNLFCDLSSNELARIDAFVSRATGRGARVILDLHNYARYYGEREGCDPRVGGPDVPAEALADVWRRLAAHYEHNDRVVFGLMNEPCGLPTEQWLAAANTALRAIRAAGATNLVLVPGNGYSGAHSWYADYYGTPNAQVMTAVVDPASNWAFEVHQYLDKDSSGGSPDCVATNIGSVRLERFTGWLRQHGYKGFLGEFAAGTNVVSLAALDDMLGYVDRNSDVWLGWTYWAAGPWWGPYMFSVEPAAGQNRPQMGVLTNHLYRALPPDGGPSRDR